MPLGSRVDQLSYLIHINTQTFTHHCRLIGKGYVYVSIGVLDGLGGFGCHDICGQDLGFDDFPVNLNGLVAAFLVNAPHDPGKVYDIIKETTRHEPLIGISEVKIAACFQSRFSLKYRLYNKLGCARRHC